MRFLVCFFLCCYDMVNSCSSYKRVYYINLHLSIFNLFIQFYKLLLIFSLCFYYIQIISSYEYIKQVTNCNNLLLCILR